MTVDQIRKEFGDDVQRYPSIAGEWNATSTNGCIDSTTPELAVSLMPYLESLHLGLSGCEKHTNYEPTDYSSLTVCTKTPSESGGGRLLANYPND